MRIPAALLVVALIPVVFAGDLEDLSTDLRDPDPGVRLAAVRRLARIKGESASAAIATALSDRDPGVREAAVAALGGRKDETATRALRASLRRFAKDAPLLAATVASLGASEDIESAAAIGDLARKSAGKDPALFRASVDALGLLPSPESLKALMDLHGSATGGTRAAHPEYLADIEESLREVTGLPFKRVETWAKWWRHARKDWRATPVQPEPGASGYRSDGWRFLIEKPEGERWTLSRPAGTAIRILFEGGEEARFAWVEVLAHAVSERSPETAEQAALAFRRRMEGELRDIRNAEYAVSARLGKTPALRHTVTGIFEGGHVAGWRAWFLLRHGIVYVISAGWESGASEKVRAEIESIIASIRFLAG